MSLTAAKRRPALDTAQLGLFVAQQGLCEVRGELAADRAGNEAPAASVLSVLDASGCLAGSGPDLAARLELSHFAVQDLAAEWEGAESTAGLHAAARHVAAMLAASWPQRR